MAETDYVRSDKPIVYLGRKFAKAIEKLVKAFPREQQDRERRERMAALDEWEAECSRLKDVHRVEELQAAADAAEEACFELWEQLAEMPAKSVVGVALKLAAALHWSPHLQEVWTGRYCGEKDDQMVLAARADARTEFG